jgi:hypothetical protein
LIGDGILGLDVAFSFSLLEIPIDEHAFLLLMNMVGFQDYKYKHGYLEYKMAADTKVDTALIYVRNEQVKKSSCISSIRLQCEFKTKLSPSSTHEDASIQHFKQS